MNCCPDSAFNGLNYPIESIAKYLYKLWQMKFSTEVSPQPNLSIKWTKRSLIPSQFNLYTYTYAVEHKRYIHVLRMLLLKKEYIHIVCNMSKQFPPEPEQNQVLY